MLRIYEDKVYSDLTHFSLPKECEDVLVQDKRPTDFYSAIDKVTRHKIGSLWYHSKDKRFTVRINESLSVREEGIDDVGNIKNEVHPEFNISAWENVSDETKRELFNLGASSSILDYPGIVFAYNRMDLESELIKICNTIKKESLITYTVAKHEGTFYSDYVIKDGKLYAYFEFDTRCQHKFICNTSKLTAHKVEETQTELIITI